LILGAAFLKKQIFRGPWQKRVLLPIFDHSTGTFLKKNKTALLWPTNPHTMIARLTPYWLTMGLGLEGLMLLAAWLESSGDTTVFFQAAARLSGRVSLLYFAVLLVQVTHQPAWNRQMPGFETNFRLFRDFAVLHVIHWGLLAVAVYRTGFELVPFRVAGGALAYLLVVGLPILLRTDWLTESTLRRLGAFYFFWVWLVFFLTYLTRLRGQAPIHTGSPAAWWPLLLVTVGLMAWRVWFVFFQKKEAT
jgi:hypothetical protein